MPSDKKSAKKLGDKHPNRNDIAIADYEAEILAGMKHTDSDHPTVMDTMKHPKI